MLGSDPLAISRLVFDRNQAHPSARIEITMADPMYSLKRTRSDWRRPTALGILCFGLLLAFATAAAELRQDTIQAFDQYVRVTEEERAAKMRKYGAFLWIDSQEERLRNQLHKR